MLRFARFPVAVCVVVLAASAPAQVYKSVDDQGRVIYTDQQPKGKPSEKVDLPTTNTTPATAVADQSNAADRQESALVRYTRFAITSPLDGQTMEYGISAVDLTLVLEPALQEGHRIQFVLDGKPFDLPGTALSTRFGNLVRGTHTVEGQVLASNGKVVKSTGVVSFTIQLHSDQNLSGNGDGNYSNYPYGVRSPRGARSVGGAGEPGAVSGDIGADGPAGAGSPDDPYVPPVRPVPRRHH